MTELTLFNRPAQRTRVGGERLIGPDVTRALALIGVVIMNYHGYLNGGDDGVDRSWAERLFDPRHGVLTTRFAATFVMVAGIGVTLLTNRSRLGDDPRAVSDDRWRLVRRGVLLASFGMIVEWIWNGSILYFYGAFFVVAALLFPLRIRWIALIGTASAVAAAAIAWFRTDRQLDGHDTSWLDPDVDSPRNLLLRTFVGHSHPLFPWLAFFCAGLIIGRIVPLAPTLRRTLIALGSAMVAFSYLANTLARRALDGDVSDHAQRWRAALSTSPFDRGLLYTAGTVGSSLVAYCLISWVAERHARQPIVTTLAAAGRMSLTLYVLHMLVFNAMVDWWGQVTSTGLDTALIFAIVFWVFAISFAALWQRTVGMGPLERLYRRFGD